MKKRLLFVDDEALILQGLQRMLRPMREEWEMEFFTSGVQALERMAQAPFDIVVSDMRMPGMNGAQLLNEVMQRFPKTIRIILSGTADKDLVLKCVGSTHQYLSKPCEPAALKATIQRMSGLEATLQNETLRQLVARLDSLPSIPSLYSEIVEALQQPDVSLESIGDIIARDVSMMTKILKLANSAFFGLRRQIATAAEAVNYIGLDTIKSLILSTHAFAQYENKTPGSFALEVLWSHSLEVGSLAKVLARDQGGDQKLADEAFAAGLLHDVGELILAVNLPRQYEQAVRLARDEQIELRAAEQRVFAATHADVGGYLLGLWGLPVPVVEAIALHDQPGRTVEPGFSPLTAVHAADVFVTERHPLHPEIPPPKLDMAYLERLGIQMETIRDWRTRISTTLSTSEGEPRAPSAA